MPAAAKPPFRFWRFFFSLRGRVSRLAIWAFVLPGKVVAWAAEYLVRRDYYVPAMNAYIATVKSDVADTHRAEQAFTHTAIIMTSVELLSFLLIWPFFALIVKRLHDIGWRGLFALPILLPALYAVVAGALQAVNHLHRVNLPVGPAFTVDYYYVWALVLLLAILPGKTAANRYGPDPRSAAQASDVF